MLVRVVKEGVWNGRVLAVGSEFDCVSPHVRLWCDPLMGWLEPMDPLHREQLRAYARQQMASVALNETTVALRAAEDSGVDVAKADVEWREASREWVEASRAVAILPRATRRASTVFRNEMHPDNWPPEAA